MSEERRKGLKSNTAILLLTLAGLLAMPVVLIFCSVLENSLFGTNYLEQLAHFTGLYKPLKKVFEALQPIFGW